MARYVVSKSIFKKAIEDIRNCTVCSFDTETTGLRPYLGHRIFSIIVSTKENDWYFNFKKDSDHLGNFIDKQYVLTRAHLKDVCQVVLDDINKTVFMHNAKFDMHMVNVEKVVSFKANIVCTQALARLLNNQLPNYKLETLGELIGFPKDDAVEKYISKHKLYTNVDVGKKKPRKDKHFDQVPFEIMTNYGLTDGNITRKLGVHELERIKEMSIEQEELGLPPVSNVAQNEIRLIKTLFNMEAIGAAVDIDYCKRAYDYEVGMYEEAAEKFHALTGEVFADSATCFSKVFKKLGIEPAKTKTGRDSYAEENLPDNAVTELILQYRKHYKRANTYFRNYLDLADVDNVIHCNFRQGGTTTGRLSSSNPNLQNVPEHGEDESKFPIRQAFVSREGFFLAMIDYDQMEYRLLMDIINQEEVIRMILEEGLDVHTATANLANVKRLIAKNINFLSIYGGGAGKLVEYTKGTIQAARKMMASYFTKLYKVKPFMRAISNKSKQRGYVVNPMGRRLLYHKKRPYIMTNHFIQGGCADIMKKAMNDMDDYLLDKKSRMTLTVHDEIIFEIAYDEQYVLPELKRIMENSYEHKHLPLTAGIDFSKKDWFNKEGWNEEIMAVS